MLVLSRKIGERILVGDNIRITVVRMSQGNVRLGIEAPDDTAIVREELQAPGRLLASQECEAISAQG